MKSDLPRIAKAIIERVVAPLRRQPRLWGAGSRMMRGLRILLLGLPKAPDEAGLDGTQVEGQRLPPWLIDEMRQLHDIEPKIFPSQDLLRSIPEHRAVSSPLAGPYADLVHRYGEGVSHLFLVPWLNRGGADLVALNYIQAVVDSGRAGRVVVLATHPTPSPWAERFSGRATFIHFGGLYNHLSIDQQRRLLAMFLVQMAPPVIHTINSQLGFIVYCMHGAALTAKSRLYASSFCFDYSQEGQKIGYSVSYLAECYERLAGVFSDNRKHIETMKELFGFAEDKFHLHYQPMTMEPVAKDLQIVRQSGEGNLNILWAGRITRQKRPDVLLRIARHCRNRPWHFHVFGVADDDMASVVGEFAEEGNITYHGSFDGLASIDFSNISVFLYTAQWDGLPNILLEAMALGLPVITAAVGGIAELVEDGVTGFLVDDHQDASDYARKLEFCHSRPEVCHAVAAKARERIRERHSWAGFCRQVYAVEGYLPELRQE